MFKNPTIAIRVVSAAILVFAAGRLTVATRESTFAEDAGDQRRSRFLTRLRVLGVKSQTSAGSRDSTAHSITVTMRKGIQANCQHSGSMNGRQGSLSAPTTRDSVRTSFGGSGIDDAGLKEVARLKNLCLLSLYETPVTDAGYEHLRSIEGLESLDLERVVVFDKELDAIGADGTFSR